MDYSNSELMLELYSEQPYTQVKFVLRFYVDISGFFWENCKLNQFSFRL